MARPVRPLVDAQSRLGVLAQPGLPRVRSCRSPSPPRQPQPCNVARTSSTAKPSARSPAHTMRTPGCPARAFGDIHGRMVPRMKPLWPTLRDRMRHRSFTRNDVPRLCSRHLCPSKPCDRYATQPRNTNESDQRAGAVRAWWHRPKDGKFDRGTMHRNRDALVALQKRQRLEHDRPLAPRRRQHDAHRDPATGTRERLDSAPAMLLTRNPR
jgi:hypothetical protein